MKIKPILEIVHARIAYNQQLLKFYLNNKENFLTRFCSSMMDFWNKVKFSSTLVTKESLAAKKDELYFIARKSMETFDKQILHDIKTYTKMKQIIEEYREVKNNNKQYWLDYLHFYM